MTKKKPVLALMTFSILAALSGPAAWAQVAGTDTGTTAPSTPTATTTATTDPTTGTTSTVTTSSTVAAGKLATKYTSLAGSEANATVLVSGLISGQSITLQGVSNTDPATGMTTTGTPATFQPVTSKLGLGSVNIALSLAQAELNKLGISSPTPEQLQAALNGGSITTTTGAVTVPGVLQLRAEGQGWGKIANTLGYKLGSVVSGSKTDKSAAGTERMAGSGQDKSLVKMEKSHAPHKVERAEKLERPEKLARIDKVERPARIERPERAERPQK